MTRGDKTSGVKAWAWVLAMGLFALAPTAAEAGFKNAVTLSSGRKTLENGTVYIVDKDFDKPASVSQDMKTRGYRFGDVIESICHGSSLFMSRYTPKEAPGIRKENLTKVQKNAIQWAHDKLQTKYPQLAERLVSGDVLDGAGINKMIDNMAWICDHMPEDEDERAWITDVLDYMFAPLEKDFGDMKGGDIGNRIGNEIMIDAKDLA